MEWKEKKKVTALMAIRSESCWFITHRRFPTHTYTAFFIITKKRVLFFLLLHLLLLSRVADVPVSDLFIRSITHTHYISASHFPCAGRKRRWTLFFFFRVPIVGINWIRGKIDGGVATARTRINNLASDILVELADSLALYSRWRGGKVEGRGVWWPLFWLISRDDWGHEHPSREIHYSLVPCSALLAVWLDIHTPSQQLRPQ